MELENQKLLLATGTRPYPVSRPPETCRTCFTSLMGLAGCLLGWGKATCPCCSRLCCGIRNPFLQVEEGFLGLVSQFGKLKRVARSGLTFVNPLTESVQIWDLKTQVIQLQPQAIMTKDYILTTLKSALFYRVSDPALASCRLANPGFSVVELALSVLKNAVGSLKFQQLLEMKERLALDLQQQAEAVSRRWGVQIQKILIRSVTIDPMVERDLVARPCAERQAAALLLVAQGNVTTAGMIKGCSEFLQQPSAMNMRFLQMVVETIAQSTVFFSCNLKEEQQRQ